MTNQIDFKKLYQEDRKKFYSLIGKKGGSGGKGRRFSKEHRQKIAEGKKAWWNTLSENEKREILRPATQVAAKVNQGREIPEEIKQKMSKVRKEWWKNLTLEKREEVIENMKRNRPNMTGEHNPNYGKKHPNLHSEEFLQKMSKRMRGRNNPMFQKNRDYYYSAFGFRDDLGHIARSTWEANICRILNEKEISYKYEAKTFPLLDESTYTPDLFLVDHDVFVEIKGYMSEQERDKIDRFQEEYPSVKFRIVDEDMYRNLEDVWADKISDWE